MAGELADPATLNQLATTFGSQGGSSSKDLMSLLTGSGDGAGALMGGDDKGDGAAGHAMDAGKLMLQSMRSGLQVLTSDGQPKGAGVGDRL